MRRFLPLVLALLVGPLAFAAEDGLEEMIKKTDMNSADAIYTLGIWCEDNNKPTAARKWFTKVIQLDKNHEAARAKMGQVLVGDRWVAANLVPGGAKKTDAKGEEAGSRRRSSGPGPAAKDVKWDLVVEPAEHDNQFIDTQIKKMNDNNNDSDPMDSAVLTLFRADSRTEMVPRLCAALLRDNFHDLYGTSMLIMNFAKTGDFATVKRLTAFMTKASERVTEKDDLEVFAYVLPMARDRRVIPRLIELMDHPDMAVQNAAKKAYGQIALQPAEGMTSAKAKAWWDLNHDASEKIWLHEQLQNEDPTFVVAAARGLYDLRDKTLVPAVIKILKGDNRNANEQAIDLIRKITGNDWGYDVAAPPESRAKVVTQLEKWWKENGTRFEWIEDRTEKTTPGAAAKAIDPLVQWVKQLASTMGNEAQQSEQNLLGKGNEAVPALLSGLKDPGVIVRRKCNDILKSLSKTDVGFDPRGEEDQRLKGINAWTAWAKGKGLVTLKDDEAQ